MKPSPKAMTLELPTLSLFQPNKKTNKKKEEEEEKSIIYPHKKPQRKRVDHCRLD